MQQLSHSSTLNLDSEEIEIERTLQSQGGSSRFKNRMLPILWAQDPSKAEKISVYLSQRAEKISEFALKQGDLETISKTQQMLELDAKLRSLDEGLQTLSKRHGLTRRMLIYRQILGAWAALESLGHQTALNQVQGLLDCESTRL